MKATFFSFLSLFIAVSINAQSATEVTVLDTRSVNSLPCAYSRVAKFEFKQRDVIGVPGAGGYSGMLTIAPWSDNTGDKHHQINFNNGGIYYRSAYPQDNAWGAWAKILTSEGGQSISNGNLSISNGILSVERSVPEGGYIDIRNHSKTQNGTASSWRIYNMTGGSYGNSLHFFAYDNIGCGGGGLCHSRLVLTDDGNVGIGVIKPGVKLDVAGVVRAQEVRVCVTNGCDYVFADDYKLMNLNDLSRFVKTNKHLPEVAPAAEMEAEGINLSEMSALLLKKVEELTLYVIELKKENVDLKVRLDALEK